MQTIIQKVLTVLTTLPIPVLNQITTTLTNLI